MVTVRGRWKTPVEMEGRMALVLGTAGHSRAAEALQGRCWHWNVRAAHVSPCEQLVSRWVVLPSDAKSTVQRPGGGGGWGADRTGA